MTRVAGGTPLQVAYHGFGHPGPCGYLPDQTSRLEFVGAAAMSADEYAALMLGGWRRFGRSVFRPRCPSCVACRPIRIDVRRFRPNRSQQRVCRLNERDLTLSIVPPAADADILSLYHRFHASRQATQGWPSHADETPEQFAESFVDHPFPTECWRYSLDDHLLGVGFVDPLPPVGLSAIYFVHDPSHRARSLGTWNVLRLIEETASRGLPHLYLGYYVEGCQSMAYKGAFGPHEVRGEDGVWGEPGRVE